MLRSLIFAVVTFATVQAASREIPITDIVSTVGQEKLQHVDSGRQIVDGKTVEQDYAKAIEALERDRGGASSIFLVDAANLSDAIKATQRVLVGFRSADKPVPSFNVETGNNWLAVYLGCGHSNPRKWIVESALVNGSTIRLTYRHPKTGFQTADVVHYYYWVPIGALDDGAYNLELYDSDLKGVTLMRRVEVKRR
jgi:hypothetical protein